MAHENVFPIKQGDLYPPIEATLKNRKTGQPIDLTNAVSVEFRMRNRVSGAIISGVGAFAHRKQGRVRYQWVAGNTAIVGDYDCEWVVTWPGPAPQTVPSSGFDLVTITERITVP